METAIKGGLEIRCAYETLAIEVERALSCEYPTWADCSCILVVDKPVGFALKTLLNCAKGRKIVITDNPCPEYWEDLWELQPQILLAGGHNIKELANALMRASKGERYRKTPHYAKQLTPREREILRHCAIGQTNEQIAERLSTKKRTVKNSLSTIYAKLNLEHRAQASLYYWGLWHWLPAVSLCSYN